MLRGARELLQRGPRMRIGPSCVDSRGLLMWQRGRRTAVGRLRSRRRPRRVYPRGWRLLYWLQRGLRRGFQTAPRGCQFLSGTLRKALSTLQPRPASHEASDCNTRLRHKVVLQGKVWQSRPPLTECSPGRAASRWSRRPLRLWLRCPCHPAGVEPWQPRSWPAGRVRDDPGQ